MADDVATHGATTPGGFASVLVDRLSRCDDARAELARACAEASRREALGGERPGGVELLMRDRLLEAGVGEEDGPLPPFSVLRPPSTSLAYLRCDPAQTLPWESTLAVLRVEHALNVALLSCEALEDPDAATLGQAMRLEARLHRQAASLATEWLGRGEGQGAAEGDWEARVAIASGIEGLRVPWRLTARFRCNAAAGLAAIECDLVPPEAWPTTAWADGLGAVRATDAMRRRAAADYDLRLVVLMARFALLACPELDEVWVAGVVDDGRSHACYASVRVERSLVEGTELDGAFDPVALLRSCEGALDVEDGELWPVRQTFSLEDERLCPPSRYRQPELCHDPLDAAQARALGCPDVSGLSADEGARRRAAAEALVRRLGSSTEQNVRELLACAEGADDDVARRARSCVERLVVGELPDDPVAIATALVGDGRLESLSQAAHDALLSGRAARAAELASQALACVPEGTFDDTDDVAWRCFGRYCQRVAYNVMVAPDDGREVRLVPGAYVTALLMRAIGCALSGRADEGVACAREALRLAPTTAQAQLALAQCLDLAGRHEEAAQELCRGLGLALEPESLLALYLRLAQVEWQLGRPGAALACCRRAAPFLPAGDAASLRGLAERLVGRAGAEGLASLGEREAQRALEDAGVPDAPTERVGQVLLDAARAATDAGVFLVARDLMRCVTLLGRDDVTVGMLRSFEDEPDC